MPDPLTIPAIAQDEFRRRQARAQGLASDGHLTEARAESEMRAWAAIAVLCGAPGVLEDEIARYRETIIHYPGNGAPPVFGHLLPEDEARCDLARDLCGPNTWGPILSRARDAAIGKATSPDTIERARNLNRLAAALDVPLTEASCARPVAQIDRKAA